MISHRLGMIAGRRADDAALFFRIVELQQFVERTALLVGGGELKILEFQPHFRADDVAERAAMLRRRFDHGAVDTACGGFDIGEGRAGVSHRNAD